MRFSLAFATLATFFARAQAQTLLDIVNSTGVLSTLNVAIGLTDLGPVLDGPGNFTVFAPQDSAFAALDPALLAKLTSAPWKAHLTEVLLYHVINGAVVLSTDLTEGAMPEMANGETTEISLMGGATVNGAPISIVDQLASNGVAHVTDGVLVPSFVETTVVDVAVEANLTLADLVIAADLVDALSDPNGNFTVFAPTNEAFAALPGYLVEYLTSDEGTDDLVSILTFHVLGDVVAAGAIPDGETKIPSLESSEVTITKTTDGVTVESANVVDTDVLANNGIIHFIDAVIVPPSVTLPDPPTDEPTSGVIGLSAVFGLFAAVLAVVTL